MLGTTIVMLIPVLALAFSRPALKGIRVPLDERTPDGIVLAMVMAGSMLGLLIVAWGLLRLEERLRWTDESTQLVWRGLGATAGVLALIVVDRDRDIQGRAGAVLRRRLARVLQDEPGQGLRPGADHLVELRQPLGVVGGGRGRVARQAGAGLGGRARSP